MEFELTCMSIASLCFVLTGFIYIYYGLCDYWNEKGKQAAQNRMDNLSLKEIRMRIYLGGLFLAVALIGFGRVITMFGMI
jgi:hypothetical protein